MYVRISVMVAGVVLLTCGDARGKSASDTAKSEGSYPLDNIERVINRRGRVRCPTVPMTRYRGKHIRLSSPVRIYTGFRPHLEAFEKLVRKAAIDVYGWAPRRIKHLGTYNCRRIRLWPTFLSEHGLGNGIDVAGFDFGPPPRKIRRKVPRALRYGFKVRVDPHWNGTRGVKKLHRRFLHLIGKRLIKAKPFRVMLGPADQGHENHFHLDMAPWSIINIF